MTGKESAINTTRYTCKYSPDDYSPEHFSPHFLLLPLRNIVAAVSVHTSPKIVFTLLTQKPQDLSAPLVRL